MRSIGVISGHKRSLIFVEVRPDQVLHVIDLKPQLHTNFHDNRNIFRVKCNSPPPRFRSLNSLMLTPHLGQILYIRINLKTEYLFKTKRKVGGQVGFFTFIYWHTKICRICLKSVNLIFVFRTRGSPSCWGSRWRSKGWSTSTRPLPRTSSPVSGRSSRPCQTATLQTLYVGFKSS